ncbi:MAG: hypothetical protein JWL87_533 [Candidatus Adlerbacteria bacterium]|nr:hypothetical protein [Candidatus Adlerbacteria bacterium]
MGMCAAAGLLVVAAVFLSSGFNLVSGIKGGIAVVNNSATSNAAAVAYWPTYDGGYPNPLNDDTVYAQNDPKYGCGAHFCWQSAFCANPYMGALSARGANNQTAASRVQNSGAVSSSGMTTGVAPGGTATLDYACQPYRTINYIDGSQKCTKYAGSATNSYANSSTVTGPGGAVVYSGSNLVGSASVNPPGGPGTVSTYTLECKGQGSWKTSVSVRILTDPPEVAITGNGSSGTVSVDVGEPVTIAATFDAATGDALEKTAINDIQNNLLPGVTWVPPTDKTYAFTPTAPGQYVFYPAVQTTNYPGWNNYSKSLTVSASLNCKANAHAEGNSCVCNAFYQLQGGICTISCPPNASEQGGTCACNPGYNLAGTSCILFDFCLNIPGAQTAAPENSSRDASGNCGCSDGYQLVGSSCMLAAVLDIKVNGQPSVRVRSGTNTTITWSASNITPDTCSVRDAGQNTIGTGTANPSPAPARVAAHENTYTLTCTDLSGQQKSASATVKIIPSLEEV